MPYWLVFSEFWYLKNLRKCLVGIRGRVRAWAGARVSIQLYMCMHSLKWHLIHTHCHIIIQSHLSLCHGRINAKDFRKIEPVFKISFFFCLFALFICVISPPWVLIFVPVCSFCYYHHLYIPYMDCRWHFFGYQLYRRIGSKSALRSPSNYYFVITLGMRYDISK